ncbi:MAG: hypothetical protein QG656_685 [Candidatus Hydrogenedentes bacterium]|nr:hypothetical protein [Candidatus Hydrogenedentota bacterium]
MPNPIRVHPGNPKCFLFRGSPRVLVTATEHYGAVMNRPFRFERYLADAAEKGMTLTRLFCLFRELQNHVNPYSTCKPESPDYIAPFPRTGPGSAADAQPKFDLDRWNPEFFDRLHRFVSLASDYGIVVEVVLLSNTYEPRIWALNPLHAANNVNGLPEIEWYEYTTMRHAAIFERQAAHVRKIVTELNPYDNVLFEICNEPGGGFPGVHNAPSPDEVDKWQQALAEAIRQTEAALPNGHLIAGHDAFTYAPWAHPADRSFEGSLFDAVDMHPLPNLVYKDRGYDMGNFMSKQLCLRPLRDFCLDSYAAPKPLNMDEDNIASQYKDPEGWTIHRKRAWTTLMCGAHYDYIDFSIVNYCETGTEASQRHIRAWMGYLSRFIHTLDLVHARPLRGWLDAQPPHTCESVLAVDGEDYGIYLADERELTEPGAGAPLAGPLAFTLPEGQFQVAAFSPATGEYSPWWTVAGGAVRIETPPFEHDLVIRVRRAV